MRVIEVARVDVGEGLSRLVFTVDGEPASEITSVDAKMSLGGPTQISVNGRRVAEPTRVVRRGQVLAEDLGSDRDVEALLRKAAVPITRESLMEAVERASTYEPHTSLHHPRCPGIASGDMTQCGWLETGCFW